MGLLARFYRCDAFDLQSVSDQLGTEEFAYWQSLPNEKRRCQWLMGRLAIKQLFVEFCQESFCKSCAELDFLDGLLSDEGAESHLPKRLQVVSIDKEGKATRPALWLDGIELKDSLSISVSHTEEGVLVAMQPRAEGMIGVDLAPIESFTDAFARFWIPEISHLNEINRQTEFARYWVAKESAYKCLNEGTSFRPRRLRVRNLLSEEVSPSLRERLEEVDRQPEMKYWESARWLAVENGDDHSKRCFVSTGVKSQLMLGIALEAKTV